jgi:iron-sulfur cluster repair protein YtfE (RIC family)
MPTEIRLSLVHAHILRQHVEIRARLRGIVHLAKSSGKVEARHHLQMSLAHFASVFEQHLSFEERELMPLVKTLDAWGEVRVEAMRAEHAEQRRRVERIVAYAEAHDVERRELEGEVNWLAQSLLGDMSAEETELGSLEELETAPQMTG